MGNWSLIVYSEVVLSTKRDGWVDKVLNILVLSTGMDVSVDNRVGGNFYISAIFLPASNAFCEFLQHLRCVHVVAWTAVDDDYLFHILLFFSYCLRYSCHYHINGITIYFTRFMYSL